jgi:calcineurin-like phosphoesterase family protein
MSRTWFTADLHIGHRLVADLRGFNDITDHDEALADTWNTVIHRDDVVWVLGDVAMSNPTRALELLASLPGRKRLIAGNHDGCHPMHSRAYRATLKYQEAFEFIAASASVKINGVRTLLSHFPYAGGGDRGDVERYTQWRLPDEGMPLLHGHTHSAERGDGRIVHVGLDAWAGSPVLAEFLGLSVPGEHQEEGKTNG